MKQTIFAILLNILFTSGSYAFVGDSIVHFSFDEASSTNFTQELVSDTQFPVANHFNNPERIQGVLGSALRLDGYSTYASNNFTISGISNQLTIESWYSTEAFSASTDGNRNPIEDAAIISQIDDNAGFALKIDPYGRVVFDFYADGSKYEVKTSSFLEKYVWNHIVATADLVVKEASIYVNGMLLKKINLNSHTAFNFANTKLYLGKHNENAYFDVFNLTLLNGALDDIKIFNNAFEEHEVRSRYEALAPPVSISELYENFEAENYGEWNVVGEAFGSSAAAGTLPGQQEVSGYEGNQLVNSFLNGDASEGKLISPPFLLDNNRMKFLIGGGNHPGECAIRLVIDNEVVLSTTGNNSELLVEETWNLEPYIGQTANIEIIDSITGGWGHILIDQIVFTQAQELLAADLFIDPNIRHSGDFLRPAYHPMPNTSWTNEPYGLTYYKGRYHLFFQKNPNGPYLHFMHWGHLSSKDLVDWREDPVVLAPTPGFDDFGIWSGTTITDFDGKPVIVYTGVNTGRAGIGLAYPKDDSLISWEKYAGNPVIANAPSGLLDFRDPFVWKDNGLFYMIVGSGKAGETGGTLVTYRSEDLVNWETITSLHSTSDPFNEGFFWEMPLFYQLEANTYVLGIGPLFIGKRARFMYWTGTWENEKFTPFFEKSRRLDLSDRDLLAPAIGKDSAGRITYIGIIPEDRDVADQVAAGWRHTFSLPRVVRLLNDNSLGQIPHPNLCRLREEHTQVLDRTIEPGTNFNLPEVSGNQIELEFKIKADSSSIFSIQLYKHEDATEFTSIKFDLAENKISLDRRYSSLSATTKDVQTVKFGFDYLDTIEIRIFLDHSTIEVFVDKLTAFSSRVYPSRVESENVDLIVNEGEVRIISLDQWTLSSFGEVTNDDVCEPNDLPDHFKPNSIDHSLHNSDHIKLYPNPTKDFFFIDLPKEELANIKVISIFTATGSYIRSIDLKGLPGKINIQNLPEGIYYIQAISSQYTCSERIIINR